MQYSIGCARFPSYALLWHRAISFGYLNCGICLSLQVELKVRRLLSGIVLDHSDNGHGHGGHHEASHHKHTKHGHKAHHQADVTMAAMEVCAPKHQTAAV